MFKILSFTIQNFFQEQQIEEQFVSVVVKYVLVLFQQIQVLAANGLVASLQRQKFNFYLGLFDHYCRDNQNQQKKMECHLNHTFQNFPFPFAVMGIKQIQVIYFLNSISITHNHSFCFRGAAHFTISHQHTSFQLSRCYQIVFLPVPKTSFLNHQIFQVSFLFILMIQFQLDTKISFHLQHEI
ncbi:hypothetical protein TTHERM_000078939 (macronuclear) [Tetrahymena thermophila SB210]|uniref:Uncharacterized protein n=1 Tax=Tetrahymena thermophila (strain SB210) TaxID=312017 RepID=W7XCY1_TETTS|nr:hypothetical protein TTHERM_000078939 [Tetrahymena thermophila SB210]EWS74448.1 hypothetical protein TTHERM_000078939 [Tetrahymena thermophila SB210]|eukprot:XP_012653025.1 hypothetical protein TTHERM_000078939 [Tetrahymena thermophila SB210]